MQAMPKAARICPDCKGLIRPQNERCPTCGRKMDWVKMARPWYLKPDVVWGWPIVLFLILAVLWMLGTYQSPPRLKVGGTASISHEGEKGAWLAIDGSFDDLLASENSGGTDLLNYLQEHGRVFREPNGSRVLVLRLGLTGGVFVQVLTGVNPKAEGWMQYEFLRPAP